GRTHQRAKSTDAGSPNPFLQRDALVNWKGNQHCQKSWQTLRDRHRSSVQTAASCNQM
ncbi:unnamed protein product, partial [Ceratitis capitata]